MVNLEGTESRTEYPVAPHHSFPSPQEIWTSIESGSWAVLLFLISAGYISRGRIANFFSRIVETQDLIADSQKQILEAVNKLNEAVDKKL